MPAIWVLTARSVLALIFLAAGSAKLVDANAFGLTLISLGLASRSLARIAARCIAGMELSVGLLIVSGVAVRWTDVVVLTLTTGFLIVAVRAAASHSATQCRCFGALSRSGFGPLATGRAFVLVGLATVVILGDHASSTYRHFGGASVLILVPALLFAWAAAEAARAIEAVQQNQGGPS